MAAGAALEHEFLNLAKARRWDDVKKLVAEHPALVNAQPGGRWSALHQAASSGNAEVVAWLLGRKADAGAQNSSGQTPLDVAKWPDVRRLIAEKILGPAGVAAAAGAPAVAGAPVAAGALAAAGPLAAAGAPAAAAAGVAPTVAGAAVGATAGAASSGSPAKPPSARVKLEHTFLDLAKARRWPELRAMLAAAPDLLNVQPSGRWSALHQAASSGSAEAVDFLVRQGADAGAAASDGRTPRDVAVGDEVRRLLAVPALAKAEAKRTWATALAEPLPVFEVLDSDDEGGPGGGAKRPRTDLGGEPEAPLPPPAAEPPAAPAASSSSALAAPAAPAAPEPAAPAAPAAPGALAPAAVAAPAAPAAARPRVLAYAPICSAKGDYELSAAGGGKLKGAYAFSLETRRLHDESGGLVGTFCDDAVAPRPFSGESLQKTGLAATAQPPIFECISVIDSEIIEEIQKPSNEGAFFVLPSQLNGAEYPSHRLIVHCIEDYKRDHTGGPRGQLAVHPAAGQFLLDNAACEQRPGGISAVDLLLERFKASLRASSPSHSAPYDLHVRNGYLALPVCPKELQGHVLRSVRASLHSMRCLCMQDVPACGLSPSLSSFSESSHRVSLVYASAVPVQAYLNFDNPDRAFQDEIGRLVILGQYYGALRAALERSPPRARIFLMPLGGGVFNNRPEAIADAVSSAIALLAEEGVDVRARLDIRLLTFKGKPSERERMERLLRPAPEAEVPTPAAAGSGAAEAPSREADAPWAAAAQAPAAVARARAGLAMTR